jgi:hypothetical protein
MVIIDAQAMEDHADVFINFVECTGEPVYIGYEATERDRLGRLTVKLQAVMIQADEYEKLTQSIANTKQVLQDDNS